LSFKCNKKNTKKTHKLVCIQQASIFNPHTWL